MLCAGTAASRFSSQVLANARHCLAITFLIGGVFFTMCVDGPFDLGRVAIDLDCGLGCLPKRSRFGSHAFQAGLVNSPPQHGSDTT